MKSKPNIALPVLETRSTGDLRATAKAAGVKVGKSKKDTIASLLAAIAAGTLHFKSQVTLSFKPEDGSASRQTFYGATLRTYTSGPGAENDVWHPATKPVISGSPADSSSEE